MYRRLRRERTHVHPITVVPRRLDELLRRRWSGAYAISGLLVIDIFQALFRLGKRILFCKLDRVINFMIDPRLQLIDSGRRDQATISEKMFKPVDRIAFLPILEKFRRYISGIIVSRMTRHAECFAFDKSRTLPGTC